MKEENIMKSILKYLKLESLILSYSVERIEPENVSELSDDELVRLGLTTIVDRLASVPFVLTPKKKHQSVAVAALSERVALLSGRSGRSRRGGRGEKRKVS